MPKNKFNKTSQEIKALQEQNRGQSLKKVPSQNTEKSSPWTSLDTEDLINAGICLTLIPLTWILFFGWRPGLFLSNHDALSMGFPYIELFLKSGGDWTQSLYSFYMKGGTRLHDVVNTCWDYQIFAWLGLPGQLVLALHMMCIQVLIGFLSLTTVRNLAFQKNPMPYFFRVLTVWLFSFIPFIAWRLSYGHDNIAIGANVFIILLAFISASLSQNKSKVFLFVTMISIALTLQSTGQQGVINSLVFGLPIFIALLWDKKAAFLTKDLWWILVLGGAAFLLSAPKFVSFFLYAVGDESARSLGKESVTYSYITATLQDWMYSLFWTKEYMPSSRKPITFHEINYAFGPFVIWAFMLPWKKYWKIFSGVFVSLIFILLFSMNVSPFSDWLLALAPPLNSFRVPERAIYAFAWMLPLFSLVFLFGKIKDYSSFLGWGVSLLIGLIFFFLPSTTREFLLWAITAIALVFVFSKKFDGQIWFWTLSLCLLTSGSLAAFSERLLPMVDAHKLKEETSSISSWLLQKDPSLSDPLNRVLFKKYVNEFTVNTGAALGFSIADGYWFPPLRYLKTVAAIDQKEVHPTELFHAFNDAKPNFQVMKQLYNVKGVFEASQQGQFNYRSSGNSTGQAWFSSSIVSLDTYSSLGAELRKFPDYQKTVFIVNSDPFFISHPIPSLANPCENAKLISITTIGCQEVEIKTSSPDLCPLTVSTNFISSFSAKAENSDLQTFPAYGTLTGIMVPAGEHLIKLSPKLTVPQYLLHSWILGWLLFAGLILLLVKLQRKLIK